MFTRFEYRVLEMALTEYADNITSASDDWAVATDLRHRFEKICEEQNIGPLGLPCDENGENN